MESGDGAGSVLLHDDWFVELQMVVLHVVVNLFAHPLSDCEVIVPADVSVHIHQVTELQLNIPTTQSGLAAVQFGFEPKLTEHLSKKSYDQLVTLIKTKCFKKRDGQQLVHCKI